MRVRSYAVGVPMLLIQTLMEGDNAQFEEFH